jgi:drug/metabolite transporter (DMT)-like permease
MFCAAAFWGLMAPVGKDAMTHGISGIDMVAFRVLGGAVLFWIGSLFCRREQIPVRDVLKLAGAGLLGLVFNQCCYTIGLSITSPSNASIMTTSMPIFAMLFSFLILHEPITLKKAGGVALGCAGAVMIILTSAAAGNSRVGDIRGDLLCIGAQLSFTLYLSLFKPLVQKYSLFTVNKWMFTWATIFIWPFTFSSVAAIDYAQVPAASWWELAYVVFFGTFLGYILMMIGQKTLRPTVVSVYNYVQPLVSVTVSVCCGLAVFKGMQAVATVFIFSGVWLVIKSRSRRDIEGRG